MKKRTCAFLCMAVVAMVVAFAVGKSNVAKANDMDVSYVETLNQTEYKIEGSLFNLKFNPYICNGDFLICSINIYDDNGNALNGEHFDFATPDQISEHLSELGFSKRGSCFYTTDPNGIEGTRTCFEYQVPDEAFGKYVFNCVGLSWTTESGEYCEQYEFIRSDYPIGAYSKADNCIYMSNDGGKTAILHSFVDLDYIEALNKFEIPANIKIGKKHTVTSIGEGAFSYAPMLKSITINANLKSVGEYAFVGINKKATIKIKANKKNFNRIVKLIKKAGAPKTVKFKRIKVKKK